MPYEILCDSKSTVYNCLISTLELWFFLLIIFLKFHLNDKRTSPRVGQNVFFPIRHLSIIAPSIQEALKEQLEY